MANVKSIFASMKALVVFAIFALVANLLVSCDQVAGETDEMGGVLLANNDTLDTTIVVEKNWRLVKLDTLNKGDRFDYTLVVEETNSGERHTMSGHAIIDRQKTGYPILEDQEVLTPSYANRYYQGGATTKVPTDTGYIAVTKYSYPTEDGNIIYVTDTCERVNGVPGLRVIKSEILSLIDPSQKTRALYKVKDAPIEARDLVSYEIEGLDKDVKFTTVLTTGFDRDLMAEDDIKEAKLFDKGFKVIDATTDRCWLIERFIMKSGETNDVEKNFLRKREFKNVILDSYNVSSFVYNFSNSYGIFAYEAEKAVNRGDEYWSVYGKKDQYTALITGEKPITTKYTLYTERVIYKDKWIETEFPYVTVEVTEGETNVKTATSDIVGKDKAILTNNINTVYEDYPQALSEYANLYKDSKHITNEDFDKKSEKKVFTPLTETVSVDYVTLYSDGEEIRETFTKVFNRLLEPRSNFVKIASDESQRTGEPSLKNVNKTSKTDGDWSWTEEVTTITSDVTLNGATATNAWEAKEANDIKVGHRGKTYTFGHDTYTCKNSASVGAKKLVGDYAEYPYSAVLSYVFSTAAAKKSSAPGTIKVLEENPFFPKEWGKLKSVAQTTSINKTRTAEVWVWSLHFEKGILPVIFEGDEVAPAWDFSLFEEGAWEEYNSAFYYKAKKTWVNAKASDEKDYLEWYDSKNNSCGNIDYATAKAWKWDREHYKNGRATVFTQRYELKVNNGTLFAKDAYNNRVMTDEHVNKDGGWK